MNKSILIVLILLFLSGLSFHYDQSFYDFGEILLPNQFSLRSHFLFIFSQFLLFYYILIRKFKEMEFSFFIMLLIFLPSIYVYRFGIYDELTISVFVLSVFIRDGISSYKISFFNLIIILFLFFSSFMGLYYSIKSFRYIFQTFSILLLILYISNKKPIIDSKLFIKLLSICSFFYYFFVIIAFFVTAFNASFLNLYLYGLGYAPTTIVNLPSIFIVPFLTYGFSRKYISYKYFILPILLGLAVTILSDSRTGFFPYLLCLPLIIFKVGFRKSLLLFFYITVSTFIIGLYQFDNPFWIYDTFTSLFDIFKIGGTTQITYYDHTYDSASGDTGRFIYIFSPILFYINNPFYLLTGVGNYGFFVHNYSSIVELSKYFNSSLDIVTSGLIISGKSSIPRPPTFPSFLIEYGIIFSIFIYYVIINKIFQVKFQYFKTVFYLLLILLTFFIEVHESLFFYFVIFNSKNILHEI